MGSGNNPSTKADLFSAQRPPDSPSLSAVQQKSTYTDEPVAASSQLYALPANLPSALSHLDDDQLDRLLAAVMAEQQRRGKTLPVTIETSRKQRTKEVPTNLTLGKLNAVRAAFKAGVTPSRIARQFGVSLMIAALMVQPVPTLAESPKRNGVAAQKTLVEIAPRSSAAVARYTRSVESEPSLTHAQKLALLQKNIKFVFVLFQENRSFDFHFGTYPGARGLFSQAAAKTPGFVQPIVLTDGSVGTISPFLIPQSITDINGATVLLYPEDTDSVNHGHTAIDAKLDLNASNVAQNDRYAFTEEGLKGTLTCSGGTCAYTGPAPTEAQVQKGELVVSHVDCNTVPFLWQYADHFTLFDNFFDTVIGPSTPNAIAMIAGQSGMTQWVK